MKKLLFTALSLLLVLTMCFGLVACNGTTPPDNGDNGGDDTGDTGDTGDTVDTGDTGDTGDNGNADLPYTFDLNSRGN
ncbi:MAG: hypothetical protein J6S44_00645, partial [Clostridia bacterium]|nr:hypothetical protein [Clostridia bacterium]